MFVSLVIAEAVFFDNGTLTSSVLVAHELRNRKVSMRLCIVTRRQNLISKWSRALHHGNDDNHNPPTLTSRETTDRVWRTYISLGRQSVSFSIKLDLLVLLFSCFVVAVSFFSAFFLYHLSPRYNRNGWLGVKHRVTSFFISCAWCSGPLLPLIS